MRVLRALLVFCSTHTLYAYRDGSDSLTPDEEKADPCNDIVPGSETRESAWLHKKGCKCPEGSLIAGDAPDCILKQGQRYFSMKDVGMTGKCKCAAKVLSRLRKELSDVDLDGTDLQENSKDGENQTISWDCAMYQEAGFEAGDIVKLNKKNSAYAGTVHVVACPKKQTRGIAGRICLRRGYKSTGCWLPKDLEKTTETKIDSFQMALKKFTGRTELTLANFYSAANEPGAWKLENSVPTLFNMAGFAWNFGNVPPPKDLIRFWEDHTCDARFQNPIGRITVGISYDRSATVDASVEKMVGHGLEKTLGPMLRSKLLADSVGASYTKINDQLASEGGGLIVEGLEEKFFDIAVTDTASSRIEKRGMLLMEFTVCKIASQVRFFQCHLSQDSTWIGRGTAGDFLATSAWRLLSGVPGLGYVLDPIIMGGIKKDLPGQVMYGVSHNGVGDANVCMFEGGIQEGRDRTQELFRDLNDITKCPQAVGEPPLTPPEACLEPKTEPPKEEA